MKRLKLAGVGCGSRTTTYMTLAALMPERYEIVGVADPISWKVERIAQLSGSAGFRKFASADQLLAADKFADVVIIATQDSYHVEPCLAALEKGYDVVLEKPIATNLADVLRLEAAARRLGRRVLICHVLRYTPFYRKVKEIVDSGELGEIVTLQASEGVGTFHQAHSFVRGHWGVTERSSPMIIAKSCHDLDIIQWLMDRPVASVSSFGRLSLFTAANKPEGAPGRCVDGCPVGDGCQYNAMRYLTDQRGWLGYVYNGGAEASDEEVRGWLRTSPWGRCVYQCDNTAVDHQVLNMSFVGGATATFTMSAFDSGRNIEIWGTRAVLRGGAYTKRLGKCDITVREHATGETREITVEEPSGGYKGHGGGDWGLVDALHAEMQAADPAAMRSSLPVSVRSHVVGFAAEVAREESRVVDVEAFLAEHGVG
jgi:predicted dehydrogenase